MSNPIMGRRIKLHNRRVWMGRDGSEWVMHFTRLDNNREKVFTELNLTNEAMEAVIDLYFVIRNDKGPAA
jgi:hypothetical protein